MLDRACSNTAIDTAFRLKASVDVAAAKEKILEPVCTALGPVCLARLPATFVVAKLTAVNDPLAVKVKADSSALLCILIFVPPEPLLLVNMLMV